MKKMLYFMAAALPAMLLINASNAEAQRKNHTRADVTAAGMQESEKMMNNDMGCQCAEMSDASCKCGKMSKKDMKKKHKKHHDRLQKEMKEINEEYDEAIEMIDKSSFSEAKKKVLRGQAEANRDLALKQLKETNELRMQQMEARKGMMDEIKAEKKNRKAIEEVNDID